MSEPLVAAVVEAVRSALPDGVSEFALHEPEIGRAEREHVARCLESGWVSSAGGYVDRFERALAPVAGVAQALAVQSGTAALHLALTLLEIGPDDEVLVPSLTFIGSATPIVYCGGTPHFVDVEPATRGVDAEALRTRLEGIAVRRSGELRNRETGRRIRALIVVHLLGHAADVPALEAVCAEFDLTLVHDAAEALGTRIGSEPATAGAKLAVTSFNGNKIVTCGGGGALLSSDAELSARARHLAGTARTPHAYRTHHDAVGFNLRMPSLNAALGYAGLLRLEETIARKRALGERYAKALADVPGVGWLSESPLGRSNAWLHALLLEPDAAPARDLLLERLHAAGIRARPAWDPLHSLLPFGSAPRADLSRTEDFVARLVCLPSHPGLWSEL